MSNDHVRRVEKACQKLVASGSAVTFTAVAGSAGIGRATLYRRPELRAIVDEHRSRAREAHTLSGLAVEVDQLRASLEAVAAKVRRHDEVLRRSATGTRRKRNQANLRAD
jgi:hypothetical protein